MGNKINLITPELLLDIKKKSALYLPDNPSAAGMTPQGLKHAFAGFVTDATKSSIAEQTRVINEINAILDTMFVGVYEELPDISTYVENDIIMLASGDIYIATLVAEVLTWAKQTTANDLIQNIVSGIQKLAKVSLNTSSPAATLNIGETRWNAEAGTDEIRLSSSVVRQNGRELVVQVRNNTAHVIANGQPVYVSGASGSSPNWHIDKASSNNDSDVLKLIGMATEDILPESFGYICIYGEVNGINTSAFEVNDVLYLGTTAGTITNVRPNELTNIVILGTCIRKHSSEGAILLRTQIIPKLANLSGVNFEDLSAGQVPIWNGTYWENYQIDSKFIDINAKNLEQDGRLDNVESGLIEIFQDAATKAELTTHNEDATAHLPIRQEIEDLQNQLNRVKGRGDSWGELVFTQSQLLAMEEAVRTMMITTSIRSTYPQYTPSGGDLVYTKEVPEENTNEWEYNSTSNDWVDNGAYTVQIASNSNYGIVKGNGDYVNIVNGILEILKSDYATRVGTDLSNSYTYSQLKTFIENLQVDVNDRYTKSQVYNKTEIDAIIEQIKSLYDLEVSVIYNGDAGAIHVDYANITGTNFVIMEAETEYTLDEGITYKKQLNTFTITTDTLTATGYNQLFSIYNKDHPSTNFGWFQLYNNSGYLDYYDGDGSVATQGLNLKLTAYKMKPLTAENMGYDNTVSGLTAENVQEAIDELENELENEIDGVETIITNITNGTTDISFTDEDLTATNLADAISEVNDRVDTTNTNLTNEIATTNLKVRLNELKTNQLEESVRKVEAGDTKGTVSDTEVINLPLNTANGQLKPTLNGRTIPALENLVTNGDFSDGTNGWRGVGGTIANVSGQLELTLSTSASTERFETSSNLATVVGNIYYVKLKITTPKISQVRVRLANVNAEFYTVANTPYLFSGAYVASAAEPFRVYPNSALLLDISDKSLLDNVHVFNLTSSHGVTSTSGPEYDNAVADIEAMLALNGGYISSTSISAVNGNKRIKSVGKNLFNGLLTQSFLSSDGSISNTDTNRYVNRTPIKVKPNTTYTLNPQIGTVRCYAEYDESMTFIQRPTGIDTTTHTFTTSANTKYIHFEIRDIDTNDINVMLEQGSVTTTYEPYKATELYLNAPRLYGLPNGVKDKIRYHNGAYTLDRYVQELTLTSDMITNIDNTTNAQWVRFNKPLDFVLYNNTTTSLANAQTIIVDGFVPGGLYTLGIAGTHTNYYPLQYSVAVPLGTYTNLTEAKTALTGTKIWYQLATPITTEIPASGNLLGNSKGVVYVENVVADVDVYTTKIDITNTDLPIKEIEKIAKLNEDGTETQLNVANAVINVDKLSFTHPSLTANDKVYFIYKYEDDNNVFGLTNIEYFNSNNVIIDSVDGKAYRIVNSVSSGVLTQSLVEVL